MKLSAKYFFTFLMFIILLSITSLAQTVSQSTAAFSDDYLTYFTSLAGLAALVLIITDWLKQLFNFALNYAQYVSWAVSIFLSLAAWFFQWGIFAGTEWWYILVYGISAGLLSNGLFDWDILKAILTFLKLLPAKK